MRYVLILLAAGILASCSPKAEQPAAPNTLTDDQKKEGWMLLFNGTDLSGWRAYRNDTIDCWDVQDGAIHCKDTTAHQRGDLVTVDQYDNFELAFEWKVSPGGNSGVIYRVSEENPAPYLSGPEYQVIDDTGYKGDLTELQKAGADYDMYATSQKAAKPAGEWNTGKILMNGNHCEHWLNGVKVVEYEMNSDDWKARKAQSKWNEVKPYGQTVKGHIDLQEHGHEVWYRSIMVRKL